MLHNYLPIIIFIILGVLFGLVPIALGALVSPKAPDIEKKTGYECGFSPFQNARMQFDVRFYLVAILFVIFDLEIAFLFPWAVVLETVSWPAFFAVLNFIGLLLVGFIYEWKKGALEWE